MADKFWLSWVYKGKRRFMGRGQRSAMDKRLVVPYKRQCDLEKLLKVVILGNGCSDVRVCVEDGVEGGFDFVDPSHFGASVKIEGKPK